MSDMASMQESAHGAGFDYAPGSPHLRHARLRHEIVDRIRALTTEQFAAVGQCHVLEIGGGHGGFTDVVAAMGATVTVTEMSRPSYELLAERYRYNHNVRVVYDDGSALDGVEGQYDLALFISVLHHVPDYLALVQSVSARVSAGGSLASFQDPLWYPRRTQASMIADKGAYFVWRATQGQLVKGLRTRYRRLKGVLDEGNPSDMVEYHVVRSGVDDIALCELLSRSFTSVEQWSYWSTQSPALQALGERTSLKSSFGVIARHRESEVST